MPLYFQAEGVDDFVLDHFGMEAAAPDLGSWKGFIEKAGAAQQHAPVRIALVGKYVQLEDAYLSVVEALRHSGFEHGCRVEVDWVDSETVDDEEVMRRIEEADGILIPGGFGERGIEGKIAAARVAREQGIPYLGICLGMQMAVAEFARHVVGMENANSSEFDPQTPYPVVDLLPEQKEVADMGGTMRLGADPVKLHPGTRAREIYGEAVIYERHRHRYEVNNFLRRRIEAAGLVVSGTTPDERLVEVIELPDHPFFVASQYHPEFKSRPDRPAPLFREFVGAAQRYAPAAPAARAAGDGRADPRRPCRTRASEAPCTSPRAASSSADVRPASEAERGAAEPHLRRALPHPEPVRARGGRRRPRHARAGGHGARASRPTRAATCSRASAAAPSARCCSARTSTPSPSTGEIEPVVVDGGWENAHDAILGADNKAAVAVFLEVARRASVEGAPVGIELLLTVEEENALAGAKEFDASVLRADFGYVFDHATPIGEVIVASPTYFRHRRRVPRPRRARRHPPGGRALRRSSPPRTRSRRCRTGGSTTRRPPTSGRSRAASARPTSCPSAAGCSPRCARSTPSGPRRWSRR